MDKVFVTGLDVNEALMELHDASMSKNVVRACEGRAGKPMINFLTAWMDDEHKRGTDPAVVVLAVQAMSLSMLFTVIGTLASRESAHLVAATVRDGYVRQFDQCIEQLEKQAA